MKYDVFMRLNRGSVKLTEQELRNCLFRGSFNNLIKELCQNANLLSILGLEKPHKRMDDAELILRYFAFSDNFNSETLELDNYKSVMKTFLNMYMYENKDFDENRINCYENKFKTTINKVYSIFGEKAFRLESLKVNELITSYPINGSNEVVKPEYKDGKVYINKGQYFDNIPQDAREFYIGDYQPAQKWLKDCKDRLLNFDDILPIKR